ncbi:mitochondrial carrier [Jaminaea rosea]|uniref:Mitochondrial carrier n=1 Tax=Jaminaea rosea TaxID=1569628 RepID=A0A316UTB8_9BASI|nr:mitochondrial carrier [Jaminaea rosea]PWN28048.1 mitochondrial carrier [Jaminaea rosea]
MAVPKDEQKAAAGGVAKPGKYPFYLGGLASASAASITHPLDLTRYRLQTASGKTGMIKSIVDTAKNEGPQGLFHGLTSTWLRQFTYSIARFAVYEESKTWFTEAPSLAHPTGKKPTGGELAICAATAGTVAGVIGNPAELVLVRVCGDLNKPPAERFAYGNCLNGLARIAKDEGVGRLFLGLGPNVARSVVMNIGQLGAYDLFKGVIQSGLKMEDGPRLQFLASFAAGTTAVTLVCPFDVVKQRVQNSKSREGVATVVRNLLAKEGPRTLFRGWLPSWLRLQPQTTLLFLFFEQYKKIYDDNFRSA